jgi:hypothetical protein
MSALLSTADTTKPQAHRCASNGGYGTSHPSIHLGNVRKVIRVSGSPVRTGGAGLVAFSLESFGATPNIASSGDVFRMPAEDHVEFGMLLQFFERVRPSGVQQPILLLRFVDPGCYQ